MTRIQWRDPFWNGKRKPFLIAVATSGLLLVLLFLTNLSYLYGALFKDSTRTHRLNILAVDFDGDVIGSSLHAASEELAADSFPGIHFHSVADYPTVQSVRNAVCRGDLWGAVISREERVKHLDLHRNEAHYPTVQEGYIQSSLESLIAVAWVIYHETNGILAIASINTSNSASVGALLNPIQASNINIMPTGQGDRVFYNTVSIVMPIVQTFFFLLAINGIHSHFGIYGRLSNSRIGFLRLILSYAYTFVAALTIFGYVWAYRDHWAVDGGQFILSWLTIWMYMHVNFLILDTFTAFIPLSFLPFGIISWVIINIASTIFPFEMNPGFYKWGYALPAHQAITILWQIWSGGCNNLLHIALPVLFAWEIVGMGIAACGSFYRNGLAKKELMKIEATKTDQNSCGSSDIELTQEQAKELLRIESHAVSGLPIPIAASVYVNKTPQLQKKTTE